ncbi:MAG: cache domain-containing protein, partial [Pyrinomonadaceae bacterium]
MPSKNRKISLIYFIIVTLLLVGLVPLVLTGWMLSNKSGRELTSAENRYQTQLVQEKAHQMEMFGKRYGDLVSSVSMALELSDHLSILSAPETEQKLGAILKQNPDLLALNVKPTSADSLSVFRPEAISRESITLITTDLESNLGNQKLLVSQPQLMDQNGNPLLAFAAPVVINGANVATVVAVTSLKDVARAIVGMNPTSQENLWKSGLPIIFVIDQQGKVLFHPDPTLAAAKASLTELKIVQEWQDSNSQVQSALVPFTAEFDGEKHNMIGAY